jgi:hypothetical protein
MESQVNGNSTTGFVVPMGRRVRVWSETTVTLAVTQDPPQFVKYTFGSERMVPNNAKAIADAERRIHEFNVEVVTARVQDYAELVEDLGKK